MAEKTVKGRTLERAAYLSGGTHALARRLKAPSTDVARWINGDEEPPNIYFLRAVDLVLAEAHERPEGLAQDIAEAREVIHLDRETPAAGEQS
jgi:hypothetical protein